MAPIAIEYKYKNDEYNDLAQEFNIHYYSSKNKLKDLISFVKAYPDKLINIRFEEGLDMDVIETMSEMFDNIRVRLDITDIKDVPQLKERNVKFFFDYSLSASTHGMLASLIKLGATAVYISDDLCYDMENIKLICKSHDVQTRCVLNKVPNHDIGFNANPRSMIYLPQDIDELAKYFDVFEFDCGFPCDWNKFDVLYRVFFQQKKWHGDINEINEDISDLMVVNDNFVYPNFTTYKLNCGRRCDSRVGSTCDKCEKFMEMSNILQEKNVYFK